MPTSGQSEAVSTSFRDMLFICVSVLLLIFFLIIRADEQKKADIQSPGQIIVEIIWNPAYDTDVDLWLLGPTGNAVGYSNKSGTVWDLLRDDLGFPNDPLGLNYENAYTRGVIPGEYCVNLHLYRNGSRNGAPLPIMVKYRITMVDKKADKGGGVTLIAEGEGELEHIGHEITLVRFTINDAGNPVEASKHNIFKPLRAAYKMAGSPGP